MKLYTIGHSTFPIDRFIEVLQQFEIQSVVDSRSVPYSRHVPQYNKKKLTITLNKWGIGYIYAGDRLGGFPKDPQVYRSERIPVSWEEVTREIDYQAIMMKDWYQVGIDALIFQLKNEQTVILCSEENPADCHRQHLVTQSLLSLGVEVWHIRKNSQLQSAWLTGKDDMN